MRVSLFSHSQDWSAWFDDYSMFGLTRRDDDDNDDYGDNIDNYDNYDDDNDDYDDDNNNNVDDYELLKRKDNKYMICDISFD